MDGPGASTDSTNVDMVEDRGIGIRNVCERKKCENMHHDRDASWIGMRIKDRIPELGRLRRERPMSHPFSLSIRSTSD